MSVRFACSQRSLALGCGAAAVTIVAVLRGTVLG